MKSCWKKVRLIAKSCWKKVRLIAKIHESLYNDFFLGDLAFTFLPIGVTCFINYFLGKAIFLLSEWAYTAIIISSLALTRAIELKVIYQKDDSRNAIGLSRLCVLLVIFSTVCTGLYTLKEQGFNKMQENVVVGLQFFLLVIGVVLLYLAHFFREKLLINREKFPETISANYFHICSIFNLKEASSNIRATCAAFEKEYIFVNRNKSVDEQRYRKKDLERLVEDMQEDLNTLKKHMESWDKPPYSKSTPPEIQDDSGPLRDSPQHN